MKRFCVRDLHGPFDARTFAALASDARIQWREPLAAPDLARAGAWLQAHPDASLRLYGSACAQLETMAAESFVPTRVWLDGPRFDELSALPGVLDLTLEGAPAGLGKLLAAFPVLETLETDFRGAPFELEALANVPKLRRLSLARTSLRGGGPRQLPPALAILELRDVGADGIDEMLCVEGLRALRLCGIARLRSIDALTSRGDLRILALESLTHLESLRVLASLPRLESLDIAGLWQFSLADAAVVTSIEGLRHLAIDIGGRRKNVEIYKKVPLPKPPPFDLRYDLTTS